MSLWELRFFVLKLSSELPQNLLDRWQALRFQIEFLKLLTKAEFELLERALTQGTLKRCGVKADCIAYKGIQRAGFELSHA